MARRSAPSAQPSYLPHPQLVSRGLGDPNESAFSKSVINIFQISEHRHNPCALFFFFFFTRFLRTEVFSPEKLPGNISVATAIGLFVGGIVAVRTWGDLLVPE